MWLWRREEEGRLALALLGAATTFRGERTRARGGGDACRIAPNPTLKTFLRPPFSRASHDVLLSARVRV